MRELKYFTSEHGTTKSYNKVKDVPHITYLTEIKTKMSQEDVDRAKRHMEKFGFK